MALRKGAESASSSAREYGSRSHSRTCAPRVTRGSRPPRAGIELPQGTVPKP